MKTFDIATVFDVRFGVTDTHSGFNDYLIDVTLYQFKHFGTKAIPSGVYARASLMGSDRQTFCRAIKMSDMWFKVATIYSRGLTKFDGDDIYTSFTPWVKVVSSYLHDEAGLSTIAYWTMRRRLVTMAVRFGAPAIESFDYNNDVNIHLSGHLYDLLIGYALGYPVYPMNYVVNVFDRKSGQKFNTDPATLVEEPGEHTKSELIHSCYAAVMYFLLHGKGKMPSLGIFNTTLVLIAIRKYL
jgi:hypothetical protein